MTVYYKPLSKTEIWKEIFHVLINYLLITGSYESEAARELLEKQFRDCSSSHSRVHRRLNLRARCAVMGLQARQEAEPEFPHDLLHSNYLE